VSKNVSVQRLGASFILVLFVMSTGWGVAARPVVLAQRTDPASPEWYQNLPPDQPGFPVALSGAYLWLGSSPTLADLNGDGTLEVIVAGRDLARGGLACSGRVYVYRHDGSLMWQKAVRAAINSTPTAADLNGDGTLDVVVSMGGFTTGTCWNGGVIALNGANGNELWTFDTQDWLNHNPDGWLDGVFSTPAVGDINGDGQPEVTFGAWDQCIYLLNRNGQPLWGNLPAEMNQVRCGGHGYYNADTIWSSPALADVTGDGRLEIIVGADISQGNRAGDADGGYLYILNADGQALAREWMDQVVYSSPAVADLDNDGAYEFAVGTGTFLPGTGYYVTAFEYNAQAADVADRLQVKWRSSTTGRVFASPAVADLNQDGVLDVVVTSPEGEGGGPGGYVFAWRGDNGAELFHTRTCDYMGKSADTTSSPTVADIDGDGRPEILLSHLWEVAILNHDGTYYTDYSNPKWPGGPEDPQCARGPAPTTELTYWAKYTLYASPAVGDLDGDGDMEVVIGGHNPDNSNQGMLLAWTGHPSGARPWPMFHRDAQHDGRISLPSQLLVSPASIFLMHPGGTAGTEQTSLLIQNTGDTPVSWRTTAPDGVTLNPSSGTVTDKALVTVEVATTGRQWGMFQLGNITVTGVVGNETVSVNPSSVPVTLYVGEVHRLWLPAVLK
jgi:hypothetical protein